MCDPFKKSCPFFIMAMILMSCGYPTPRSAEQDAAETDGWIGLYVQEIDPELRKYLELDTNTGILVNEVVEDGPADQAGIRKEDVIIAFDGKTIYDTENLASVVRATSPNEKARVEIVRRGSPKHITIRIGSAPEEPVHSKAPGESNMIPFSARRPWIGIRTAELNGDLADYFSVNEDDGILILSVVEDSPADIAGLRAGDILHKFDGKRIRQTEDLDKGIDKFNANAKVGIEFIRKGDRKSVKLNLNRELRRSLFRLPSGGFDGPKNIFSNRDLFDMRDMRLMQQELDELSKQLKTAMDNLEKTLSKI